MFAIFIYICVAIARKMYNQNTIQQLKDRFGGRESFTRKELYNFFCEEEPGLKETTFRWRIYDLKKDGVIRSLSRGVFAIGKLSIYVPGMDENIAKLGDSLSSQFSGLRYCIWPTKIINEFMLHIPGNSQTIIEVEADALEPVFNYLKDLKTSDVFLQPSEIELERYVSEKENPIIIKSLVTRSPIQIVNNVPTVTLEKLIVDLFSDKKLFSAYQGSELTHIINKAIDKYSIDATKMLLYAARKTKDKELTAFLKTRTDLPKTIFND